MEKDSHYPKHIHVVPDLIRKQGRTEIQTPCSLGIEESVPWGIPLFLIHLTEFQKRSQILFIYWKNKNCFLGKGNESA